MIGYFINKYRNRNQIIKNSNVSIKKTTKVKSSYFNGTVLIGENGTINSSTFIKNIKVGEGVIVKNSRLSGKIIIGDNCKLLNNVSINGFVEVGNFTSINGPNTDLTSKINKIKIGNFCSIARNVSFQEYNHDINKLTTYFFNKNILEKDIKNDIVSKGDIEVGHDVWIGTQTVVLSGAKIGTGSVIAANSVVVGEIPPYSIAGGSPAKVIKSRFDKKISDELLKSEWWDMSKNDIIKFYMNFNEK